MLSIIFNCLCQVIPISKLMHKAISCVKTYRSFMGLPCISNVLRKRTTPNLTLSSCLTIKSG